MRNSELSESNETFDINVDIRKICFLGKVDLPSITNLPLNSVFFLTDDGFFVDEKLFVFLRSSGQVPPVKPKIFDEDDNIEDKSKLQESMIALNSKLIDLQNDAFKEISHFFGVREDNPSLLDETEFDMVSDISNLRF